MKKTLVALAALATVGAAFAQSSVTLYGKIDWTIQNQTQKTSGVKTTGNNVGMQVQSAGLSGSRWGMKGTEDLGGGMKAIFDLQAGFNIDTAIGAQGAAGGTGITFGRQAYAGLSGGFGTFTVGRQYSPLDTVWGTYDGQGYTTNSAMGYAWNGGLGGLTAAGATGVGPGRGIHAEPGRVNNSLLYATPALGGFQAQLMYAPGENKTTGTSAGNYVGFLLGYANGPLGVHLGYEKFKGGLFGTAVGGATSTSISDVTLAASYDLGVAKLYGGYQRAELTGGSDDKGWMFGVGMPLGPVTLNLGYAREKNDVTGLAFDGRNTALGGQVVYALSKRTNVYADFLTGRTRAAAAVNNAPSTKNNIFGVGMRHDF